MLGRGDKGPVVGMAEMGGLVLQDRVNHVRQNMVHTMIKIIFNYNSKRADYLTLMVYVNNDKQMLFCVLYVAVLRS